MGQGVASWGLFPDPAAAEDEVVLVEDAGLTWGDGAGG
jgi:hypothetical protein